VTFLRPSSAKRHHCVLPSFTTLTRARFPHKTPLPIRGLYNCEAVPQSPKQVFRGAISLLVIWFALFLEQVDLLVEALSARRVGSQSGSWDYRRRVGSTSYGSFIAKECYESCVQFMSWHQSPFTISRNHMPDYRAPPRSDKWVCGVPNTTQPKKKSSRIKIYKIQISAEKQSSVPAVQSRDPALFWGNCPIF